MSEPLARLAVRWLRDTEPQLLATYRGVLTDELAGGVDRWPREILADLDRVAVRGQVPADRVGPVRLALIRAELAGVLRDPTAPGTPLTPLPPEIWHRELRRAAEDVVLDALHPGTGPPLFDAVLRLAKRLGVRVRLDEIPEAVDAFVTDWADHPGHRYAKACWDNGEELEGMLRDELTRRILAGGAERVGSAWWERLLPEMDTVETDLDRIVLAAAMRHSPPERRAHMATELIGQAAATGRPERVADAARCLWRWTEPTESELRLMCRLLPDGPALDGWLFASVTDHLATAAALQPNMLDLAGELVAHQLYQPPPDVHRLLHADQELHRICGWLPGCKAGREFNACVTSVRTADRRLRARWAQPIAEALLAVDDPEQVGAMLGALPDSGRLAYVVSLVKTLRRRPDVPHLLTAVHLSCSEVLRPGDRDHLGSALDSWIVTTSERSLKRVAKAVDAWGDPWPRRWAQQLKRARARTNHRGWWSWGGRG